MAYTGMLVTDVPVELNVDGVVEPVARVGQDPKGKLDIEIRHASPWAWIKGPFQINSTANYVPSLRITRAHASRVAWAEDHGEIDVKTTEALLMNREPAPAEEVHAKFFLSGVNFFEPMNRAATFTVAGRTWTLQLFEDSIATGNRLRAEGFDSVTATLSCGPLPAADVDALDSVVSRIQGLLSFALGGFVRQARRDVLDQPGNVLTTRLYPVQEERPFALGPVNIDGPHPGLTKKFLESSYGPFTVAEGYLPMNALVQLLLLARAEPILEIRALIVANFLEVLRFNYAAGVLVPAGRAFQKGDNFYWPPVAPPPGKKPRDEPFTFKEIIQEFAADKALTGWSDAFKDLRNKIVHSAEIPGANFKERFDATMNALHFCDSCILALFDWDKAGGDYIPCNQPEHPDPKVQGNNLKPFVR